MTRRTGTSSSIIRKKDLKPAQELSDQQLLASAERAAARWIAKLEKDRRAEKNWR